MQIFRQYASIPKIHMLNLWITCVTILHPVHVVDAMWSDYTMHQHATGIAKIMPKSQTK